MSESVQRAQAQAAEPSGKVEDFIAAWIAGGLVITAWGTIAVGLFFAAVIALLVVGLLVATGALKWLLLFAAVSAPVGWYIWRNYEPEPPPAPPLRQRRDGLFGTAAYAEPHDVQARGLLPAEGDFSTSVYLGEYLNWYTPLDQSWQRTNSHVGYAGENNILTVAPAGSGKFTTTIAQTLMVNTESAFVLDVKGESWAVTSPQRKRMGHRVVTINPFNMFGTMLGLDGKLSDGFNPLAKLDPKSDSFVTDIDALAAAMIVQEGNDPHFPNRARDLVACLMAHVCSDPEELKAGNNHLPRVRQLLGLPREELAAYMEAARSNPMPRVANLAGGFTDPVSREIGGVISTAIGQLSFLDHPQIAAFLSRSTFDFGQLRTGLMTIYLMIPPNELNTYYRFARLIVQACFNALSVEPKPGDRRVLLLLDEQAQLKYMETVVSAIALLRGYRVRIWSVFQDLNQLESIYKDRWESFLSNAGVVQVFTTNDERTARYFSAKAGNYTGTSLSETTSTSTGDSEGRGPSGPNSSASTGTTHGTSLNQTGVPLLSPQELYSLPEWQGLLFVRGMSDVVPTFKQAYWQQEALQGGYLPNPYHDAEGFKAAFLAGYGPTTQSSQEAV
jgi:type IV secretion system protein VirD4